MFAQHDTLMVLLQPPSSSNRKPIYARSGWEIPCETENPFEPVILQIQNREFERWMTYLTLRTRTPHFYNCVGMIFAARRAWIEIDHIYDILREDQYRAIAAVEVEVGDVVLYKINQKPTHVGLIMQVDRVNQHNTRVMSKFGAHSEFFHFLHAVPQFCGEPAEYWTDRR